jgi:hypothetical protein
MTKRNLILRAAMVAAFALTLNAQAQAAGVAIDLDATPNLSQTYATELIANGGTLVAHTVTISVASKLGFGVSAGATRFIRYDFGNAELITSSLIGTNLVAGTAFANGTIVQGGAVGDNYVIYQVTADTSGNAASNSLTLTFSAADLKVLATSSPVTVKYSLHETGTSAQTALGAGTAVLYTKSGNLATFAAGLKYSVTPNDSVASVNQAFKKFTTNSPSPVLAKLGDITYDVATAYKPTTGLAVALSDLVTTATLTIAGDFSAVDTTVNGGIFTSTAADCLTPGVAGAMVTGNASATITVDTTALAASSIVCYAITGTTVVPAQSAITSALTVLTKPSTSTAASVAAQTLGTISHDGTTMVAPLAQVPTGWISRLVLNNSGTVARDYTVTALGETGNTITLTGAAASGTIQPGTTVIDLAALMTATGAPRSGLKVVVTAPQTEIDGLFQIVNGTSGSISNHVLSYK